MDAREKEIHAQQHKAQVDLNERHAKLWGNFQKRRDEHAQKYGSAYADILLRAEKEDLETQFNQDNKALSERYDQQWLSYHEHPVPAESSLEPVSVLQADKAALNRPEIEMKTNDPKSVQSQREPSQRSLFANPFNKMEQEQKQMSVDGAKDIDQSTDYMKGMLSVQKDKPAKEKEGDHDRTSASLSERFSQGLRYTIVVENNSGPNSSKPRERDKDMDRD